MQCSEKNERFRKEKNKNRTQTERKKQNNNACTFTMVKTNLHKNNLKKKVKKRSKKVKKRSKKKPKKRSKKVKAIDEELRKKRIALYNAQFSTHSLKTTVEDEKRLLLAKALLSFAQTLDKLPIWRTDYCGEELVYPPRENGRSCLTDLSCNPERNFDIELFKNKSNTIRREVLMKNVSVLVEAGDVMLKWFLLYVKVTGKNPDGTAICADRAYGSWTEFFEKTQLMPIPMLTRRPSSIGKAIERMGANDLETFEQISDDAEIKHILRNYFQAATERLSFHLRLIAGSVV